MGRRAKRKEQQQTEEQKAAIHPDAVSTPPIDGETVTVNEEPLFQIDEKGSLVMTRSAALELFGALGYPAAEDWSRKRMMKKVAALKDDIEDDFKIGVDRMDECLDKVLQTLNNDDEVHVVADPETPGDPIDPAAPKKKKTNSVTSVPSADKDQFGLKKSTIGSKFVAHLTETPLSMQELMEASAMKQQYGLLGKLVNDGKVTRDAEKKYSLPTAAPQE